MRSWDQPSNITKDTIKNFRKLLNQENISIPSLRLWDTSRNDVLPLAPSKNNPVSMYVCGITPYDSAHLGHATTYLAFDLINRILQISDFDVNYIQNITDVDDPLFERANRDGIDWKDLGRDEITKFCNDMNALSIIPPNHFIAVTESIDLVISMTEKLLANNMAYVLNDNQYPDVYFDINNFTKLSGQKFGHISSYDLETMTKFFSEIGGDLDRSGKRNPLDALLWKVQRPGEPGWESPFGKGRPGWHIECSAIALKYADGILDIQGGGSDLIFPHHEFSASHAEALSGDIFARFYVHTGMIGLVGEKMSKSKGNLEFVHGLIAKGYSPDVIRLALISHYYREDYMWSDDVIKEASERYRLWDEALGLKNGLNARDAVSQVLFAVTDDLNFAQAIDIIDFWCKQSLSMKDTSADSSASTLMKNMITNVLGVNFG